MGYGDVNIANKLTFYSIFLIMAVKIKYKLQRA